MHKLTFKQVLPISGKQAWDFFSSPKNLGIITPKRLDFEILSISGEDKMHVGQFIGYNVTVLPFIRLYWETEITEVQEPLSFTDMQRKGPYTHWCHRHSFRTIEVGVEMTDELEYVVPLGLIGRLANFVIVENELRSIFKYRFNVLKELF